MGSLLLACVPLLGGGDGGAAAQEKGPLSWGVLVRNFYTSSPEEANDVAEDVSGFVFEDADLYLAYDQGDIAWRISADFDGNRDPDGVALEDAYVRWDYVDWLSLGAGQFRPRVMRSGSIPEEGLLFRERTFLGAAFDGFDDGIELGGHYDQFDYWFALTDGANAGAADHLCSARLEWALFDEGWWDEEGPHGAPNHLRALLGVAWFSDFSLSTSDAGGYGGDLALTFGPYAFHAEWADLEEEFTRTIDVFNGLLLDVGDGKPYSGTLSRRLGPATAAVRWQRADDVDSTEAWGIGADWRPRGGALRLVADLELVEGDTRDFSLFSVGVVLGSSGRGAGGTR